MKSFIGSAWPSPSVTSAAPAANHIDWGASIAQRVKKSYLNTSFHLLS